MCLFSAKDYDALSKALREGREIVITRTCESVTVTARTTKATKAWSVAMLVQVKVARPFISWRQNFESVEGAQKNIEKEWGRCPCTKDKKQFAHP